MEWAKNKAELWNGKIPNMKGKKLKKKEKKEKLNMKTIHVIEKSIGNNVQKMTIKYNYFTQLT